MRYALADIIKINFAAIFDVALREMLEGKTGDAQSTCDKMGTDSAALRVEPPESSQGEVPVPICSQAQSGEVGRGRSPFPSIAELWDRFVAHLRHAVAVVAEGIDFHCEHMQEVFPDLVLDLLSHGPIEKGAMPATAAWSSTPSQWTARPWPPRLIPLPPSRPGLRKSGG